MKSFLNNKKIILILENRRIIPYTYSDNRELIKIYSLDIPDLEKKYDDIKIALDDVIEMEVGEDLGIIAHLMPYSYSNTNPFKVKTSNKNIVDIEDMILSAKKIGSANITVTTMDDKYSDSIIVNVVEPYNFTVNSKETYVLEPERFGLVENNYSQEQAWKNSNGIKSAIQYAKLKGYKKILFPENCHYYYDPANSIYLKNNLILDLNGGTIQVYPTFLYTYKGIYMEDNIKGEVNICPHGWEGLESTGYTQYITTVGLNENNVETTFYETLLEDYIYPLNLTTGGEEGKYYVKGKIPIIDSYSINDYDQTKNYIVKGLSYKGYFKFIKYRDYNNINNDYTSSNIKLIMECYKEDILVTSKDLVVYWWSKPLKGDTKTFDFVISTSENYDYVKIKVEGMSDPNYPINGFLYDIKIYENKDIDIYPENIVIQNGSILGDRYITDSEGNYIKENLFYNHYGKSWTSCPLNEASVNLMINYGKNLKIENLTIGDSTGFNMVIWYGKDASAFYPNINIFENGSFDDNGVFINKSNYARTSTPIDISGAKTSYFMITDPTFEVAYYYGFRSRIVDIYCYDNDMNMLSVLKGKLRHGLLKIPDNTKYINIAIPLEDGESIPTTGNADFNNSILAIKFIYPIEKCKIKNCIIKNNYSCGIAHAGMNVLIEGCEFSNNIGRMPWCDIDSEDGWVRMQNNVFRNNTFGSYYGFVMCAGTNYVIKNNIFNAPVVLYPECQYFKMSNNILNNVGYTGAGQLSTMADTYIINNKFNNIKVASTKNHSSANYKAYFFNNVFNNNQLDINGDFYCKNNILNGSLTVNTFNNGLFSNKISSNDISEIIVKDSFTFENVDFNKAIVRVTTGKTVTFNNCILRVSPTGVSGTTIGNCIFNNCTIYNAKLGDNYVYDENCTFINGIIDEYVVKGITLDSLVFSQVNASGIYIGIQETNIKKLKDFTIIALVTITNNTSFNLAYASGSTNELILGSSYLRNKFILGVRESSDGGATGIFQQTNDGTGTPLADDDTSFVVTVTYDSSIQSFKGYLNNQLVLTKTVSSGKTYMPPDSNISISGQCDCLYYYVYNKVLSSDELTQTANILLSTLEQ